MTRHKFLSSISNCAGISTRKKKMHISLVFILGPCINNLTAATHCWTSGMAPPLLLGHPGTDLENIASPGQAARQANKEINE